MAEYIDRDDALSEIERREALMVGDKRVSVDAMKSFIKNRPAADVAPVVHGRKIEDGDIGCFWLCSLCGECLPYGANYCPNCGAKMDGGAENAAD